MTKIIAIGDTHNKHKEFIIPRCDILIHSGDWTSMGYKHEVESFAKWLEKQPASEILLTPGNHERDFSRLFPESLNWITDHCPRAKVVIHEAIEVEGIKFFLSPFSPIYGQGWSYNAGRDVVEAAHHFKPFIGDLWQQIPEDTQVLVCHTMPFSKLDQVLDFHTGRIQNAGCRELLNRIGKLPNIKHVIGGHLHLEGGKTLIDKCIHYSNCAMLNDRYQPEGRSPILIEI